MKKRRRGNGEGSIYKRRDGRWCAQYTIQTVNGPKLKYIYSRERAVAARKLRAALAERDTGFEVDSENITLKVYLSRWLDNSVRDTIRKSSWVRYEQLCRSHIVPPLGNLQLKKLTPDHLQALYRFKLDSGLSPRTVRYIHSTLHKSLEIATQWGLISKNPAKQAKPPRLIKRRVETLTRDQAGMLLKIVEGDPLEALYALAITTGMREGELIGLRWEDVDLDNGWIHIQRSVYTTTGGLVEEQPKSGRGRSVKLAPQIIRLLKTHHIRQATQKLQAESWKDNNLVFPGITGEVMRSWTLIRAFHAVLEQAGLPKINFHVLRHTCATLLMEKGISPGVVQDLLGHGDAAFTLNVYSHVSPSLHEDAANKLAAELF